MGALIIGSCQYLATMLGGIESSVASVGDTIRLKPSEVHNLITLEAMTYITLKKYDDRDNLILEATFCWDGSPKDLQRIRDEWKLLCDALM